MAARTDTTTIQQAQAQQAATKLAAIADELRARFVESDDMVLALELAAIARQHIALIGSPGEAKSNITDAFCNRVDGARYFYTLLGKQAKTEQILGAYNPKRLMEGEFARKLDRHLANAHVSLIDEGFKSNSSTLNDMLGVLNERRYEDDGVVLQCPLEFAIIASNEMPGGDTPDGGKDLAALWDRLLIRAHITGLSDAGHRQLMGDERARRKARAQGKDTTGREGTQLTLDDLHALQRAALEVEIPDDVLDSWFRIRQALRTAKLPVPSSRRSTWLLDLICAHAVLKGRTVATRADLMVLRMALWESLEQVRKVRDIVLQEAAPELMKATELHDALVEKVEAALVKIASVSVPEMEKVAETNATLKAINTIGKQLTAIRDQMKGAGQDYAPVEAMVADSRMRHEQIVRVAPEPAF